MTTPSSILALRITWTEEPGGLQPTGCKDSDTTEAQRACKEARMAVEARAGGREGEGSSEQMGGGPRPLRTQKAIAKALATM